VSALQPPATTALSAPFPQAFEHQAREAPTRPAVSHDGASVSYGELDAAANRIARLLAARGLKSGDRVGVFMDRTPLMVATLIGIQKLGVAYVPLDPGFPADRLAFMVQDSNACIVLTDTRTPPLDDALGGEVLVLDAAELENADGSPFACRAKPHDDAYILYTSGSTGRPNGVVILHSALLNFLSSMLREPGLAESDVVAAITTISFDIAALELFAPLLIGARIELLSRDTARDGEALSLALTRCEATVLQATPATWRVLLDAGWEGSPNLKALCGGEQLPRDLADAILERVPELWNLYGPTETTIWSTAGRIRSGEPIHIGRPIANTQVYVVNEHGALVPPGVAGEILIGGQGLAAGYHDRPEINAARFVKDRFSGVEGARLYRTGDLGMWADGTLRHLGRLDHQVKIRGYRIELGEIETALMSHPAVRIAVVAAQGSGASTRLVAYYVLREGAGLTASEARAHLRSALPDYMIPSLFEILDSIPMTPNGKVDRKSLPSLIDHRNIQRMDFVPCLPGLETELAEIWKEVLSLEQIGANDNFFEIGGHSLLSLRVAKAIAHRTGLRMEPRLLFTQSLRSIATSLGRSRGLGEAGA
jgi:amino acid adenylation domain-containing protein